MRRSRSVIAIIMLAAVLLLVALAVPALARDRGTPPVNENTPEGPNWIDGTYMLGEREAAQRALAAKFGAAALIPSLPSLGIEPANATVGDTFDVDVSDMSADYAGVYTETFVVQSVGTHGIICLPDYAYADFHGGAYWFPNPYGTDTEPWDRSEDAITPAQLAYLLTTFDTKIWNTMSSTFGTPLARGAEGQKVWILIHNIRDDAYYEPLNPDIDSYIAGYFSSSEDAEEVKNMMHIDTYDWDNRTGANTDRPYLYEGVFAHEYQHLLHADTDPDEESWVDEGMADLAAFLCGFMEDNSHVVYYLWLHPITPLTFFGGQLENYGACYLFQLYLWEKYGGNTFTKNLFKDQANGIQGVQNQLDRFGRRIKFDKVFDNWTLANYFDLPGLSLFGYRNIEFGPDTWGYTIESWLTDWWWVAPLSLPFETLGSPFWGDAYLWPDTGQIAPQPYTAQYFQFNPYMKMKASLDGDELAGTAAYSGTKQMVSGQGTWAWKSFFDSFNIPSGGASTLSFWTWYDVEYDWDYFYVEVYDNDTGNWTTLQGQDFLTDEVLTTSTLPQPQDNPNVPPSFEPTTYEGNGNWNAFTGSSGGWVHVKMDLSLFQGDLINIYFRTWQDGAFTLQMAYVDDVMIDYPAGADFFDNFEAGLNWSTPSDGDTGPWTRGSGLVPNDWQGTLVGVSSQMSRSAWPPFVSLNPVPTLSIFSTPMKSSTQSGSVTGKMGRGVPQKWLYIVSNRADHIIAADYYVKFTQ